MIPIETLQKTMEGLFPERLGVRLVEVTEERVLGELDVEEHHCTTPGIAHGGAMMALADTLGAYATAIQLPPGARTTTLESKTHFFAAVKSGSTLVGECLPLHRGRRTMVWQTTLRSSGGEVAAIVGQTQMILPRPPDAEEQLAGLFRDKTPDQVRETLARLEHAGAAIYENLARSESDAARRADLLESAARERANARVLEAQVRTDTARG
ncbi:MAG: PaaI family thioesterase [Myxococcota bacterium]